MDMIRLAIADEPSFSVSDLELSRGGVSYTVDTLKEVKQQHPHADLYFCLGADSLVDLHAWKNVYEILTLATLIPLARPGFELVIEDLQLEHPWPEKLLKSLCTVHLVDISSTDIRNRVRAGKSINSLVPDAVAAYIHDRKLYTHDS
jgi:nicotinate-nucleotide adenylyltransferase